MISQETVERIIDSANIVDVVSEYVTLRRAGANYRGLCPFHDDKTPSFYVSPSKGMCKCFSCGQGGNAVHFIMEMEQLSYYEALKFLAKKNGIEVEERELTAEQRQTINERESIFAVNEWAKDYFHDILLNHIDGTAMGMAYFRSRGIRDDIINKFHLGYSLDKWDALSKEATRKGYKEKYIVDSGLCYRKDDGRLNDRFRGRVIFPWLNASGKVVAFGGRVLDSRTKGVNQKYVNSPESAIYTKANELYGIFQAKSKIAKEDRVYMVEGYTDVISMHQCGIENVVANSGTALSHAQIRLLHRYTSNITLVYDGDAAGIHAALRGTDMLLAEGMNVKILLLPDGDDPDSFARKHNATEFKDYIEKNQTDFITFKLNLMLDSTEKDPIKRAQLTKEIIYSISVIPEEIVRVTYIHECAEALNMDEAVLLRQTQRDRKSAFEAMKKEAEREQTRERLRAEREAAEQTGQTVPQATPQADDPHAPSPEELEYLDSLHAEEAQIHDGGNNAPSKTSSPVINDVLNIRRVTGEDKKFFGLEELIMRMIVRHGDFMIPGEDENGQLVEIPLTGFVINELAIDSLCFRTPLYAKMLSEAAEHINEPGFNPTKYFMYSQDVEISREATNLLSEKYHLSEPKKDENEEEEMHAYIELEEEEHNNEIPMQIVRLMLDYKYAIVDSDLNKLSVSLNSPEIKQDDEACMRVMTQIKDLSTIKRELAKRLGDRVYVR